MQGYANLLILESKHSVGLQLHNNLKVSVMEIHIKRVNLNKLQDLGDNLSIHNKNKKTNYKIVE